MRRAIALDPRRAVAYLNLADLLTTQLAAYAASGKDVDALRAEFRKNYRTYLRLGGRPTATTRRYLGPSPDAQSHGDACAAIAAYTNAGRLDELLSDKGTEIPYKGRKLNLEFFVDGTDQVPTISVTNADTGRKWSYEETLALPLTSEEPCCGDKLGLLVYHSQPYILAYNNLSSPEEAVSLTTGKACSFHAKVREWPGPKATQPALCQVLLYGQKPRAYPFGGHASMSDEEATREWNDSAHVDGVHRLDVANIGKPITVLKLEATRRRGMPCTFTAYDAVNTDGARFADDATRKLLFRLQDLSPQGVHPMKLCDNDTRFFNYMGRIYFESRSEVGYRVATLTDGKAHEVCDFHSHATYTGQATEYHPKPN